LSYGTLGPSLLEYGKLKDFKPEEAKATFAKIYNAQSQLACSTMPRFGHTGFLNEEQIKDAVAYLFDKDSPVNK
jgi:sulfur-oxidizing protein SoxX